MIVYFLCFIIVVLSVVIFTLTKYKSNPNEKDKFISNVLTPLYLQNIFGTNKTTHTTLPDAFVYDFLFTFVVTVIKDSTNSQEDTIKTSFIIHSFSDEMLRNFYPFLKEAFLSISDEKFESVKIFLRHTFLKPALCSIALQNNDVRFLELCDVEKCIKLQPDAFV